jgi:Rrf2 family protein
MLLSRSAQYGVRTALHLASAAPGQYVPVHDLALRCEAPFSFLAKICHRLTRAGILGSQKGPNGGVALSLPPDRLTLFQIVDATGGLESYQQCVLGLDPCDEDHRCPLHEMWAPIKDRMRTMLEQTTLDGLADDLRDGRATLASKAMAGSPQGGP